jgi:integrase
MASSLDFTKRLADTTERIDTSDEIHPDNKTVLDEFQQDRKLNGIQESTIERDLSALKVQAEYVDGPFLEMDKSQVKDLVVWIHDKYDNEYTRSIHKRALRNLFYWDNGGEHPDETKWIRTYVNGSNSKLPEELLTKEDVRKQIEAAYNDRDKALISMLYETGARIGELIDLTVGDIEDRKHGKKVVIEGKTGSRRLPLVESVPYINDWLNKHPNPEKDAPLWCKIQQGSPDDQLGYRYIRDKILDKTMEKAGIDKPSNPHHYRHSRASFLANHLKEAQLCEWFGWVQGSKVPAKYVHLSGRDIDNAYDQMHGLYEPEDEGDGPDVIECYRCEELNRPDAKFCDRCGFALDPDAADELETAEEKTNSGVSKEAAELAIQMLKRGIDDPEALEEFLENEE